MLGDFATVVMRGVNQSRGGGRPYGPEVIADMRRSPTVLRLGLVP